MGGLLFNEINKGKIKANKRRFLVLKMNRTLEKILFISIFFIFIVTCFEIAYHSTPLEFKKYLPSRTLVYLVNAVGLLGLCFLPLKQVDEILTFQKQDSEDPIIKIKPQKQTYYDYVKERLEIERMMRV